jgi:hypothetical protein
MAPAVTLLKALLGQLMPLLRPWQAQRGPRSTLSRPRPVDQRIPIRLAHNRLGGMMWAVSHATVERRASEQGCGKPRLNPLGGRP